MKNYLTRNKFGAKNDRKCEKNVDKIVKSTKNGAKRNKNRQSGEN